MTVTLSIVAPAFNEEKCLDEFASRVFTLDQSMAAQGTQVELVIVDDHSTDRTSQVAKDLCARHRNVKYVRLSRNCGAHAASSAGLRFCSGDCVVVMAVDLQDPPEMIPKLVAKWREGYDVVWAVRAAREGVSWRTKAAAAAFYRIMRHIALPEFPHADCLLIDRKVVEAYNAIPEKHTSLFAMVQWMGFRSASIEYVKKARHAGRSGWTFAKKVKLFVDSIVSFSYVPIRAMSVLGLFMALAGFGYASLVVVGRLAGWVVTGTGYAALMTAVLVGQGVIMMMLGVLGEYLWRTYDEARGRPRYIIEEYCPGNGASATGTANPRQALSSGSRP